jgi:aspartate-semialdehyde dehydrogenase
MSKKIPVGILGATGMVGQRYISLLEDHPWFEVKFLAASPRSAGKAFSEALGGRWQLSRPLSAEVAKLVVSDASDVDAALAAKKAGNCEFVFSAVDLSKGEIIALEDAYAAAGFPVVSNNSAHRWTPDVPMLIPEINAAHLDAIPYQKKARGWKDGFIVVKPNCSIQSYMLPVHALVAAGYEVKTLFITTLQAVSGAGYPGVASLDVVDNIVQLPGEEDKSEKEPLKILGSFKDGRFENLPGLKVSAHCNRVAVVDGHTACVSLGFGAKKPALDEIKKIWSSFRGLPQELKLPFAPEQAIIVHAEEDRPQPRKDRDLDKAMAVSVGRLRTCPVLDIRFTGLHHNTVRGAAGGGILNAELLKAKGYIG